MNQDFNHFASMRFPRTQPAAWKDTPFADERGEMRTILKVIGIGMLWIALLALSVWSINDSVSNQPIKQARAK
jgi:hypothetical protein